MLGPSAAATVAVVVFWVVAPFIFHEVDQRFLGSVMDLSLSVVSIGRIGNAIADTCI